MNARVTDTDLDDAAVAFALRQVAHWGVTDNDLRCAIAAYLNAAADSVSSDSAGAVAAERERLRASIDFRLHEYLGETKYGYDDWILGFNEAWDVVSKTFEIASLRTAKREPQPDQPAEG